MQAKNSITQSVQSKPGFTATISGAAVQKMINTALQDPRRAASFTSTLISLVNSNKKLQECEPASVISAALRGEGMNLSLALQQYSVVPYGKSANFQLSYKGLAQLATRSGQYKDFGVFDVRVGEYKGKNPRTRQPEIQWIEDDDERERLPIIGYYGFYELKNGFSKSVYWTVEKILNHANRYAKAFDKDKYLRLISGKLSKDDIKSVTRQYDKTAPSSEEAAARIREGSPWYDDPTSEAHMKMCKKTVLIQMLGDGTAPLSLEMSRAIKEDEVVEQGGEFIADDDPRIIAANAPHTDEFAENMNLPEEVEEVGEVKEAKKSEPKRSEPKAEERTIGFHAQQIEEQIPAHKDPYYGGYYGLIENLTDQKRWPNTYVYSYGTYSLNEQPEFQVDKYGQLKIK